jgi:O-methyltransferase involved in polyketide biosynthesis
MGSVANTEQARLGSVQETLFIPLAARARESSRRRPLLHDPKAVEMAAAIDYDDAKYGRQAGGFATILRTMIYDYWVREFLARHPAGTVVELGTGLNTRFERVDNGTVHWIDLDLPDTIELRRRFFTDTERRQMMAASVLDDSWLSAVAAGPWPGPYFFVTEGVLAYLPGDDVIRALTRLGRRFPGARLALDTYPRRSANWQHKMAAKRGIARWDWTCDDPRSLSRAVPGLRLVETATVTKPPEGLRVQLPARCRVLLRVAEPVFGKTLAVSLFESQPSPPPPGQLRNRSD